MKPAEMPPTDMRLVAKPSECKCGMILTDLFSPKEIVKVVTIESLEDLQKQANEFGASAGFPCVVWCTMDKRGRSPKGLDAACRVIGNQFHANAQASNG